MIASWLAEMPKTVKRGADMAKAKVTIMPDDKEWQAKCDMHTLADAQEIMADKKRHAAAKKMAEEKAKEMAKVAGSKNIDKWMDAREKQVK